MSPHADRLARRAPSCFRGFAIMIRTIVFFGAGGLFTACYSNVVRRLPMWRKPSIHVICTAVGLYLGYLGHRFEESAEDRYKEMIQKHKNAAWYPQGQLLAERYAREKALLGGEEEDETAEEEEAEEEEE